MTEIQILNNGDTLYDIRRKINENFELVQQEVEEIEEGVQDPIVKFGVNEGNTTDGVADLLDATDGTLSFKVGGEYPNLVTTSGDGVTTEIQSINDLHLENLADGEYTVVVNGSNSNITDAEFYSQLLEPENPNDGDVWFNGETATYLTPGERSVKTISNGSINFTCMDSIGDLVVVAGASNKIFVSNDNMKTWSLIDVTTDSVNYSVIGCAAYNNKIYLVGNDGSVRYIDASLQITQASSMLAAIQPTRLRKVNNKFVALGATGNIAYTDNMEAWATQLIASPSVMLDITYRDGTYFVLNGNGGIFISQTLTSWAAIQPQAQGGKCLKLYGDNILIGCQNGVLKIMNKQNVIATEKTMDIKGEIKDMAILEDGSLLIVGNQNLCYTTSDLENFTLIQVAGGDLRHIHKDYMVGANGYILQLITARNWISYPYIPVGEVIISGGEITYVHTYPYNSNGLHEASSSTFGLLRTAAQPDELNCHCSDAVITPKNLYGLANYRLSGVQYNVGDTVACPYHHDLTLRCTTAGTTSQEALNTSGNLNAGETIIDGTVVWTIETTNTSNFLNKQQITNCLLEVPQRINLELTDSGLTLKAGSVVIVPNGADGFKEVIISSDLTMALTAFTGSEQFMLFYNATENGALAGRRLASQVASGTTTPTTGHWHYYNTTDNFVYSVVDGGLRGYRASFPFGLITVIDGTITSIDQVFNGMGYIGSTVWVDKGVKGLIPNGRNEDGTLKNIEFTLPNILVSSLTGSTRDMVAIIYNGGTSYSLYRGFYKDYKYDAEANVNMNLQTHPKWDMVPIARTEGDITKLVVKQPILVADIQDVVRKTGDTMSGTLELYGTSSHFGLFGGSIFTHNMNISMDTAPSSNIYFPVVEHQDKNNTRKSRVESFFKADGSHGIQLSEKHGSSYSAVTAGFDANGKAYTYAPHCDITNGIVTQAALSKAKSGYIKFGNGLIIQWGTFKPVSKGTGTVTFPTAWSSANANFGLALTQAQQGPTDDYANSICTGAVTATTFTYQTGHSEQPYYRFIAVGY